MSKQAINTIRLDYGDYEFVYGYDVAESRWLREMELENEILRGEFYDSYAEFIKGPYIEWCEDVDEMYQLIDDPSRQKQTAMSPKWNPTIRIERRD